jgi:hypothetical protein
MIAYRPDPDVRPIPCGLSLSGSSTSPEQIEALLDAGRRYRSFKHWDKVGVGSSEAHLTGQGFNAVKFDPKKPARTIRQNDGNLGMHGGCTGMSGGGSRFRSSRFCVVP